MNGPQARFGGRSGERVWRLTRIGSSESCQWPDHAWPCDGGPAADLAIWNEKREMARRDQTARFGDLQLGVGVPIWGIRGSEVWAGGARGLVMRNR